MKMAKTSIRSKMLTVTIGFVIAASVAIVGAPSANAGQFDVTGKSSVFDSSRTTTVYSAAGIAPGTQGYKILYHDVFVNSSTSLNIDALVSVTRIEGDFTLNSSGGNVSFDPVTPVNAGRESFFEVSRTAGSQGGVMTLQFDFYEGGTYSGPNTGIPAVLQNVKVTSIDLDAGGVQFTDFFGFQSYVFSTDTRLQAYTSAPGSYPSDSFLQIPTGYTRFHQNTYPSDANGGSDLPKDAVQIALSSMSTFSATIGNLKAGGSYYGLSFNADGLCGVHTSGCTAAAAINNPANRPPTSTDVTRRVGSGVPTVLQLSDFGTFSDLDSNPFVQIDATTLPGSGTLEYFDGTNWVAVTATQDISAADITAGKLRYTSTTSSSFTFKVNDGLIDSTATNTLTLTVTTNTQTIDFPAPGTKYKDDGVFGSSATSSAGLPITLTSSTTGVCTVDNSVQPPRITPVATGTCVVQASQGGDSTYATAASVSRTFNIVAGTSPTTTTTTTTVAPTTTTAAPATSRSAGGQLILGGTVYWDSNKNSRIDTKEPKAPGVVIRALRDGVVVATTTSASDGTFSFSGLSAGSYRVVAQLPTTRNVSWGSDSSGVADGVVELQMSASDSSVRFGLVGSDRLSGFVFTQSNGVPQPRKVVECTWLGPDQRSGTADDVTFEATTDSAGRYVFTRLPVGAYECESVNLKDGLSSSLMKTRVKANAVGNASVSADPILLVSELPATGRDIATLVLWATVVLCAGLAMQFGYRRRQRV